MNNSRKITFRKIAAGHYRNEETGVEIVKVPAKRIGRNGHRVAGWEITAPSYRGDGYLSRSEVGFETTLAAAKSGQAILVVVNTRAQMAADYEAAQAQYTDDAITLAAADIERNSDILGAKESIADGWLAAAHDCDHRGDYERARAWTREIHDLIAGHLLAAAVGDVVNPRPALPVGGNLDHPYAWDASPADVWLRMANDAGFYRAAAQEHYNRAYRTAGDQESAIGRLYDEARELDAAREVYILGGMPRVTGPERAAGAADWATLSDWEQALYVPPAMFMRPAAPDADVRRGGSVTRKGLTEVAQRLGRAQATQARANRRCCVACDNGGEVPVSPAEAAVDALLSKWQIA